VAAWVEQGLPSSLCIIWATGKAQFDSYRQFDRADVRVVPYLAPIANAYAASDLAFVRGGMMGTSELCAWGIPMLICPLPTAAQDHQTSNAIALEKAGAAVHLAQRNLTTGRLDATIRQLLDDPARLTALSAAARARARPHAAADIALHIANLLV
jgi:UDP-N-acetylglucosamine--N-acetylmuramyl-(pentapeptide) pyrophosphoryl-undecaprenol N-acetylglucosamine transferase